MGYIRVLSEQVYDESAEGNVFKISLDFPALEVQDMVEYQGGVPAPNIGVCFCPGVSNTQIEAIASHADYGDGAILLTGDTEAEVPSQSEFNEIRQFLLTKLTEDPPTIAQVDDAIGTIPNNKTRWEISQNLISYIKNC